MGYIFPVAAADCAQAEQAEDISAGNVEAVEVEVSVLVVGERQEEAVEDAEEADEEAAEDVAEDADAEGALAEQGVRQPSLIPLLVLGLDGYGRRITNMSCRLTFRTYCLVRHVRAGEVPWCICASCRCTQQCLPQAATYAG